MSEILTLPTGTVTFLFTGIVDGARRWEEDPEGMREALSYLDRVLRDAVRHHGGYVFKTMEGAFYVVFASATGAVQASLEAQRTLVAGIAGAFPAPSVRMALHTGQAEMRSGDYFGLALSRAARILASGHGGQILLSEETQAVARVAELPGIRVLDLGIHRLKDLSAPERVYQVCAPDLPCDFPPLDSLELHQHNLPLQMTSFIGREQTMEEVRRLLSSTRLLTLTGVGGCGKTRLAMQVAADLLEQYPGGVWWANMAVVADPALVPQAVASAVEAREEPGIPLMETLARHLKDWSALVLLDNCEHLLEACSRLADALLQAAPGLQILATSREPFRIPGETVYRVPSLSLPESDAQRLEDVERSESVWLFRERARLHRPDFQVNRENTAAVVQVCRRLDGIPLAIELAAARIRALSPEQIADRLDDRFRLLTGGSRTALPRQQTLRALIDWSYDLLDTGEQATLCRLAVFAGGCTLEAAEAVCTGENGDAGNVQDRLSSLVEKSLLIYDAPEGRERYRMTETVRQYARDRLVEKGEYAAVHRRHRDFYVRRLEALDPEGDHPDFMAWCAHERDNLRAALAFSLEDAQGRAPMLRQVCSLWIFWRDVGDYNEGRVWLQAALKKNGDERSRELLAILYAAAYLAMQQSDYTVARAYAEECLSLAQAMEAEAWQEHALIVLGHVVSEPEQARSYLEQRIALLRRTENDVLLAEALADLGHALMAQGDLESARPCITEALAVAERSGSRPTLEYARGRLALLARFEGNYALSAAMYEDHLASCRERDDRLGAAFCLRDLGVVRLFLGDCAAAWECLAEGIQMFQQIGNKLGQIRCLEGMAQWHSEGENRRQALRLFASAEHLRATFRLPLPPIDRADYARVADLREALGETASRMLQAEGQAWTLEQAVTEARGNNNG